jgi:hypothetical protein
LVAEQTGFVYFANAKKANEDANYYKGLINDQAGRA